MKFSLFALEEWFDRYEFKVDYMLGSSSCAGMTVEELFDLTGESVDFHHTMLTAPPVSGDPDLLESISTWYENTEPDEIHVTCSSTEAIFLLTHSLLKPGDSVVAMFPMYPSLYQAAEDLGAEIRRWHLRHENNFQPDFDELVPLVDDSTRLIILNNPHNPTGQTLDEKELKKVISIASRVGAKVWCDEVFRGITVKGNSLTPSIRDVDGETIAIGSMSKVFGLSGLRIGWIAAPKDILDSLRHIRYFTTVCSPVIEQKLAAIAHRHRDKVLARNQAIVDCNFPVLEKWIQNQNGIFDWVKPVGGPITFPRFIPEINTNELCRVLAEEYSVLIPPGKYTFDSEGFIRIGYGIKDGFEEGLEIVSSVIQAYLD